MQTLLDHREWAGQGAFSLRASYNLMLRCGSVLACYNQLEVCS